MIGMDEHLSIYVLNGVYNMYTVEQMALIDIITQGVNKACTEGYNYVRVFTKATREDAEAAVDYFQSKGMVAEYLQSMNGTIFWLSWKVCL